MDGLLRASAAVFRVEQNNFAVPDIDPETGDPYFIPGTTDVASRAAKGVVSKGYELEMQGEPLRGWDRSEERRVGKEGGSTCRYRGSPYNKKKKQKKKKKTKEE